MGALDFRIGTAGSLGSSSPQSVPKPAGTVEKDLLVVVISVASFGTYHTPAGWTFLGQSAESSGNSPKRWYAREVGDSDPSSYEFTHSGGTFGNYFAFVYEKSVAGQWANIWDDTGDTDWLVPSVTATDAGLRIGVVGGGGGYSSSNAATPPAGWTGRSVPANYMRLADVPIAAAGATGTAAFTGPVSRFSWGVTLAIYANNTAPNAPSLSYPIGSATIDKDAVNRFTWAFSDPDLPADAQSAYELRYRLVGAPSWTTVAGGSSEFHDFAGGTFAAGDYEWQVRTTDNAGAVGPWSGSEFFTAAVAPASPSITDPINGGTIDSDPYTVHWTAANQDAYQVRTVADDGAGNPDTGTVHQDTGAVEAASTRSRSMPFPTNGRDEHVQVRVRASGLWSAWASHLVSVAYTPPDAPTVTVTPDDASGLLSVSVSNPATGEPVVSNDIEVRTVTPDADPYVPATGVRVATGVASNGTFDYRAPASGVLYEARARAYAANGASTYSPWAS